MDFKLVIVVLFAYFLRPQDWVPGMAGTEIMKPLMAGTLLAMFNRRRGFSLASLVKTPIDWAVIIYACYIVFTAPEGQRPTSTVFVLVAYFIVTSQAISTPQRLAIYLRCWFIAILVVAAMAVMSEYGIDLTGAREITYKVPDQPRLALNTYLFDNANSLGHSVVLAIPLSYFVLFWRRTTSRRILAVLLALLAVYCVYLTKSKGAYIVGLGVLVASQIVGRPRIFQIIAIALAATVGWAALSQLPRMTEISSARNDEAIMGRMLAWEQARIISKEEPFGAGFKNFKPMIEFEGEIFFKATHSSYTLIGAELGRNGLFFYLAVLYAAMRILVTTRCHREEDERSRRTLIVLLLGFVLSGWMIDRSYHLEYFLLAGAVAGFHRRMGVEAGVVDPDTEDTKDEYDEDYVEESGHPARAGDEEAALEEGSGAPLAYELEDPAEQSELDLDLDDAGPMSGPPLEYELEDPAALPELAGDPEEAEPLSGPALAYQLEEPELPGRQYEGDQRAIISALEQIDTSAVAEAAIEEELRRATYWRRIGPIDIALILLATKIVFEIWDYVLGSYFL